MSSRACLTRTAGLAIALAVLGAPGCMRLGFGPGARGQSVDSGNTVDIGDGPDLGDHGAAPDGSDASLVVNDLGFPGVTAANDTCAKPAVVDLGPLASGSDVKVVVDVTGAKNDYGHSACSGKPEVVLRLEHLGPPYTVKWQCWDGGDLALLYTSANPAPCTSSFVNSASPQNCGGGSTHSFGAGGSPIYIAICRDPSQGPVTIVFLP